MKQVKLLKKVQPLIRQENKGMVKLTNYKKRKNKFLVKTIDQTIEQIENKPSIKNEPNNIKLNNSWVSIF